MSERLTRLTRDSLEVEETVKRTQTRDELIVNKTFLETEIAKFQAQLVSVNQRLTLLDS